jgi:uncharacterized protein (UPF0332 family)
MDLKQLEARGLIEKASFSDKQILANLGRARKDLTTSKANVSIDEEWAYTIAYHAMLRAGRALMFASGYRPKGKDQHKTVIDFCASLLGGEFQELITRFNRMRVKRHDFIYQPERPIPKTEAVRSIQSADQFVGEIIKKIGKRAPQKRLFE